MLPMIRTRWGRVITLSSVTALIGNRGQVNYAAAKGALNAATKSLSLEVASRGITVNAVAPGIITSSMSDAVFDAAAIANLVPMKRAGTADEVASLVELSGLARSRLHHRTGHLHQRAAWPDRMNAPALAGPHKTELLLFYTLLELAVIILAGRAGGAIARRCGQSSAVGEIIVGILLGPSLFGWVAPRSVRSGVPLRAARAAANPVRPRPHPAALSNRHGIRFRASHRAPQSRRRGTRFGGLPASCRSRAASPWGSGCRPPTVLPGVARRLGACSSRPRSRSRRCRSSGGS